MTEVGAISWNERLEEYFAATGEKSHCLSWCHKKAEALYNQRKTYIDLPVIVISSVVGFLSVGSSQMFEDEMAASVGLGIASLLVSVLNTTGTYFGWAKRAEGHRISAIQYSRLFRFLSIEMALPRDERMTPHDLLKYTKDQYDRLQEISPLIPPEIIEEFRKKFEKEKDISKPEEANGLEKIVVFHENPMRDKSFQSLPEVASTPHPLPLAPKFPPKPQVRPSVVEAASTSHESLGLSISPHTQRDAAPTPVLSSEEPSQHQQTEALASSQ